MNYPVPLLLLALMMVISFACVSTTAPPPRNLVEPTRITTALAEVPKEESTDPTFIASATSPPVMTAAIGGILVEENGCLRITDPTGGDAIVWQKDVLKIERQGDTLLIARLHDENAQTVTWKLGDMVRGGGGEIRARIADDHAGAGFSERCPGPYFMVGTVK